MKIKRFFLSLFFLIIYHSSTLFAFPIHIVDLIYLENPATLNRVKHCEINLGDNYWDTKFKFKGTSFDKRGTATSKTHTHFPYGQIAYRFNDKLVLGVTYLQNPELVNINWGDDSLVRFASTKTSINSFRVGPRLSYQLTEALAIGFAVDIQRLYNIQLNFAVPVLGNIKNRSQTPIYVGYELGAFYAINKCTFLNTGFYITTSHKNSKGKSTSESGLSNNHYSLKMPDCYEVYVQLIRNVNDKWTLAGKFNFSNWSIQKSLDLKNTVVGDIHIPTHWKNTYTFEGIAQYKLNMKLTLIGGAQYVTSFARTKYNLIGLPGSNLPVGIGGFSYQLYDCLGMQFIYTYAWYSPKAKIDSGSNRGNISLNNHAFHLKLTYAW